jgi:hypothetical protein
MSGWRSQSGHLSNGIDLGALGGESPAPGRFRGPTTRREQLTIVVLVIAAIAVVGVGWYAREQHRPARRALPVPIHPAVLIVPIGSFPQDRLQNLPHDYGAAYGLTMTIGQSIELPAASYDASRRQYVAQDLLATMRRARPPTLDPNAVVIGVTTADIYIRDVAWNWAFALREQGTSAVISVARMPNTRRLNRWTLFGKMMTRQVGFMCFGLPATDDPYDILYREILSVSDLDRLFDQL